MIEKRIFTTEHRKKIGESAKKRIGNKNSHWKGGVHNRKDGYQLVRIGTVARDKHGARYKLQHRIIMEEYLDRPLLKTEIVHHKNGDNSDNDISNLEIMSQAKHASLHFKGRKRINNQWIMD